MSYTMKIGKGPGKSMHFPIGQYELEIKKSMMNKTLKEIVNTLAKSKAINMKNGVLDLIGIRFVPRYRNEGG